MIIYIFKFVLCSAVLLLFYILFLEREKMLRFNRFYLLFSIVFSLVVPVISIETKVDSFAIQEAVVVADTFVQNTLVEAVPVVENKMGLMDILFVFYLTISSFLVFRFIWNIASVNYLMRTNKLTSYETARLVLVEDAVVPHTFLNHIFINKKDYENHLIENEIIKHELTHVNQKHSIDVLFVEMLIVMALFNPFIFLYKRAMQLNHEFLADESVVNTFHDAPRYQHLLLGKIGSANAVSLTSPFNYLTTKKRLIMMTRTTSKTKAILKQAAVLFFIAVVAFVFVEKTFAQNVPKVLSLERPIESNAEGVSQELLDEYQSIVDRNKSKTPQSNWWKHFYDNLSEQDRNRLEEIFLKMSKEQQQKQEVVFIPPPLPMKKLVPSKEQISSWKNPKIYGVWIDNKRVNNSELDKYSNTDFAHVFVSKLSKNTVNYGKHYYQVNLMTTSHYKDYFLRTTSDVRNRVLISIKSKGTGR